MRAIPQDEETGGPPAMRVAGLTWRVGGLTIVDDVSLEIRRGELLSVIGPNGAGKTSLINLISGVHKPQSGTIELEGEEVTRLRPADRTRRGLGRTFQTSSLFPALTVFENVRLSAQAAIGHSLDLWTAPHPDDEAHQVSEEVLGQVGLWDRADDPVVDLSHGDKRKLELAVVLAGRPEVLLLDEPTAGVSVEETRPLVALIEEVHASGKTVLMVEHRMEFVVGVSQRIAVMHQGQVLTCDTPDRVMNDPAVREAYLGQGT